MSRLVSSLLVVIGLAFSSTAVAADDGWAVRQRGARFSSDVGAACGALDIAVFFQPGETILEAQDEAPLDFLARCLVSGALAGRSIGVVGTFYGSDWGAAEAAERQRAVIAYLVERGVDRTRLAMWWQPRPDLARGADARVSFKLITPGRSAVWWMVH
ncbi:MAG: hypothetical protein U1F43_07215 [Myxococcota bacterium]